MADTGVKMNLASYLDTLRYAPAVETADLEATRQILNRAVGTPRAGTPQGVTFYRGVRNGDGLILTYQPVTGQDGTNYQTVLLLSEDGLLENHETGFRAVLPTAIKRYFFGGIFGPTEFTKREATEDMIVSGIRSLYGCVETKGAIESCSESMSLLAAARMQREYEVKLAAMSGTIASLTGEVTSLREQQRQQAEKILDEQQRSADLLAKIGTEQEQTREALAARTESEEEDDEPGFWERLFSSSPSRSSEETTLGVHEDFMQRFQEEAYERRQWARGIR